MSHTPTLSRRRVSRRRAAPPVAAPAVRMPPTVPGSRFVGSALDLRRATLDTMERVRRDHGDVVRFVVGPRRAAPRRCTSSFTPRAVRRVLATEADRYRKDNRFYEEIRWALGDGLLNSQDDRWLRQRRFIQPLFTRRRIAGYAASMAEEAADLVAAWRPRPPRGTGRRARGDVAAHAPGRRPAAVRRRRRARDLGRPLRVPAPRPACAQPCVRARRGVPREWPTPANRRAMRAQQASRASATS